MRATRLLLPSLLALGLVSTSCTGEDAAGTGTVADLTEVSAPDVSFADSAAPDTSYGGTLPPDFGDGCRDNRECSTSWCVEGPDGFVCSKTCVAECPPGWGCKGVTSGSVDLVFVCVPDGDLTTPDTVEADTIEPVDTTPPQDTAQPPVGETLCDLDPGVGVEAFKAEPVDSEWPDCVEGCDHPAYTGVAEVNLALGGSSGALGALDDGSHTYYVGAGPDIDVIGIRAPPRSMLEIAVQAGSDAGLIDPVVYVSDGFQIRTYSSDVSADSSCARTTIAYPYSSSTAIYVAVEDAVNYDAWTSGGYGPTVGGPEYAYTLRIKATPFAPTALGSYALGQQQTFPGQALTVGGETRYYHFVAPANSTPRITLTRTGSSAFVPALAVFKSDQGQMVWQDVEWDADGDGRVAQSGGFIVCHGACGSAPNDFYFAVYDWNGAAHPGTFSYDLGLQIQ